jgi:DNA-binding NarL/FixJ family response regulator
MPADTEDETTIIRVLIVDDQPLVRQGMASLLSLEEGIEIVGQAENGEEAIVKGSELRPDVVLMDIRMPIADGVVATTRLREKHPEIKVIVLTTFDDEDYIVGALKAGAAGYLLKDTPSEELANAVRAVHRGNTWLGPSVTDKVVSRLNPARKVKLDLDKLLSLREVEVLRLIGSGKSNREIAKTLHIAEGTVKNHITKILTQIGARDRTQAALWVQENIPE